MLTKNRNSIYGFQINSIYRFVHQGEQKSGFLSGYSQPLKDTARGTRKGVWYTPLLIESLTHEHNHKSHDPGDEELTRFLREKARQDQELDLSCMMVLIDVEESPRRIIGYHKLVMTQVKQEESPNDRLRITRDILVNLFGQLGVDIKYQGRD